MCADFYRVSSRMRGGNDVVECEQRMIRTRRLDGEDIQCGTTEMPALQRAG